MFKVGEKVVYPVHGAGVIESIEQQEVLGETRQLLCAEAIYRRTQSAGAGRRCGTCRAKKHLLLHCLRRGKANPLRRPWTVGR